MMRLVCRPRLATPLFTVKGGLSRYLTALLALRLGFHRPESEVLGCAVKGAAGRAGVYEKQTAGNAQLSYGLWAFVGEASVSPQVSRPPTMLAPYQGFYETYPPSRGILPPPKKKDG